MLPTGICTSKAERTAAYDDISASSYEQEDVRGGPGGKKRKRVAANATQTKTSDFNLDATRVKVQCGVRPRLQQTIQADERTPVRLRTLPAITMHSTRTQVLMQKRVVGEKVRETQPAANLRVVRLRLDGSLCELLENLWQVWRDVDLFPYIQRLCNSIGHD